MIISKLDIILNYKKQISVRMFLRTFIVALFGIIFSFSLYNDINSGTFRWQWMMAIIFINICIGFMMSKLVPIHVREANRSVTLSFDRLYFFIVLLLVIVKTIAGYLLSTLFLADVIMCILIGLMSGRLIGLYVIIHKINLKYKVV